MNPSSWFEAGEDFSLPVLWEDGERVSCGDGSEPDAVLAAQPVARHPTPASLDRIGHEYALKDDLDRPWAPLPSPGAD